MPHVSPSICLDLPWASRFVKASSVRRRDRREERRRRYLRGNRGAADNEQEELGRRRRRRRRRVIYRRTNVGKRRKTSDVIARPDDVRSRTYKLPILQEVNLISSYFISEGINSALRVLENLSTEAEREGN